MTMRGMRGLLILGVIVVALVALINAVRMRLEQPWLGSGSIHFEQQYNLYGALDSDVVAFAETVNLAAQSAVSGDAAFIADHAQIDGSISGNLAIMGGTLTLGPESSIGGDVTLVGDSITLDGRIDGTVYAHGDTVTIAPSAVVTGAVYACGGSLNDSRDDTAVPALACDTAAFDHWLSWTAASEALSTLWLALSLAVSVALGGLAVLIVTLFPRRVSYMVEAVRRRPRSLGGVGVALALLAAGTCTVYLVILAAAPPLGLVLLPVLLLLVLAFLGLTASGWVTLALLAGDVLLRQLARAGFPPLVSAAVGSALLVVAWNALMLIPYGGWLALAALVALSAVGLGAAVVTRLGARPVHERYLVQG